MLDFSKLRLTQPSLAGSGAELGKNLRELSQPQEGFAPRTSLSGRIQIGNKSGYLFIIYYLSVNIKPPRHRFGFSLAWGWQ